MNGYIFALTMGAFCNIYGISHARAMQQKLFQDVRKEARQRKLIEQRLAAKKEAVQAQLEQIKQARLEAEQRYRICRWYRNGFKPFPGETPVEKLERQEAAREHCRRIHQVKLSRKNGWISQEYYQEFFSPLSRKRPARNAQVDCAPCKAREKPCCRWFIRGFHK